METTPMSRVNVRRMIDQARKAGLQTSEIYGALVASRPEGSDQPPGQTDENGFVATFDNGHRAYVATGNHQRKS
jgi:hypothetical protein